MDNIETIFALSSGRLPAAVAVVRVSGPGARFALETMTGECGALRRMRLATVRDPVSSEALDRALTLFCPGPGSATGEDVAEFHLHGGRAVVADVLAALGRLGGFRPAAPGEFTRRAFANGVMDLAAVEGLADLVAADTSGQRRQALRQAAGVLGAAVADWRRRLIAIAALVEAAIDFSDEPDIPAEALAQARADIAALAADLNQALAGARRGERLRDGLTVVIAGPPNAGKSSLLNALARRDVAIVSPEAGTTRDVIEVHLDLGGFPVTVVDTAGLRDGAGAVEAEGVRRARDRIATADLVLWLVDPAAPVKPDVAGDATVWQVGTKADALDSPPEWPLRHRISAVSGAGLGELIADLSAAVQTLLGGEPALVTRARHAAALHEAVAALTDAASRDDGAPELMAEDVRRAGRELGRVVGAVDVEDVLDAIFRQFCIGK